MHVGQVPAGPVSAPVKLYVVTSLKAELLMCAILASLDYIAEYAGFLQGLSMYRSNTDTAGGRRSPEGTLRPCLADTSRAGLTDRDSLCFERQKTMVF